MVERREGVKRPALRSEGMDGSHRGGGKKEERSVRSFWRGETESLRGRKGKQTRKIGVGIRGGGGWAIGARGGEARATDQEPGSRGTEQVQAASEAFGPEGAARA